MSKSLVGDRRNASTIEPSEGKWHICSGTRRVHRNLDC